MCIYIYIFCFFHCVRTLNSRLRVSYVSPCVYEFLCRRGAIFAGERVPLFVSTFSSSFLPSFLPFFISFLFSFFLSFFSFSLISQILFSAKRPAAKSDKRTNHTQRHEPCVYYFALSLLPEEERVCLTMS